MHSVVMPLASAHHHTLNGRHACSGLSSQLHVKPPSNCLALAPCSSRASCREAVRRRHTVHAQETGAPTAAPAPPPTPPSEPVEPSTSQPASSLTQASVSPRKEAQLTLEQYKEIYDRLISIFQQRPRDDWKKLIVFSKQWPQHQQGVFERIKELSDKEQDVDKKMALRKVFRSLQGVNEEVNRYNSMLKKFGEAAQDEWEAIVSMYRGDLQRGFFEHTQCLMAAAKDDKEELDRLVMMNTRLVALCANYDSVAMDEEKLAQAADVYKDLLSSITSLEDADKKMAELGSQGKIDPAFLHITAKAYGAARDTNMTIDEAKWVSYKLYRNARDYFDRQQPTEKRIIEYLISIPDPLERKNQLDQAVTPGPTRATDTHDYMYTTPTRLYIVLDTTLQAYQQMQDAAKSKLGASEESVTPRKIRIMRELRDLVLRRYM